MKATLSLSKPRVAPFAGCGSLVTVFLLLVSQKAFLPHTPFKRSHLIFERFLGGNSWSM